VNRKTLRVLAEWSMLAKKKLRNVKKIYLAVELDKRAEAIKSITADITRLKRQKFAERLELNVANKNLCPKCEFNGKYPLCAPTEHVMVRDNDRKPVVLKCRNFNEVE